MARNLPPSKANIHVGTSVDAETGAKNTNIAATMDGGDPVGSMQIIQERAFPPHKDLVAMTYGERNPIGMPSGDPISSAMPVDGYGTPGSGDPLTLDRIADLEESGQLGPGGDVKRDQLGWMGPDFEPDPDPYVGWLHADQNLPVTSRAGVLRQLMSTGMAEAGTKQLRADAQLTPAGSAISQSMAKIGAIKGHPDNPDMKPNLSEMSAYGADALATRWVASQARGSEDSRQLDPEEVDTNVAGLKLALRQARRKKPPPEGVQGTLF